MKIAVYTCITQGYDVLQAPLSIDDRLDYHCFSDDQAVVSGPWKYVPISIEDLSPKDQNRYIKMHPHEFLPGYDITLYVDGNIHIIGDLHELIHRTAVGGEDIHLYRHPMRNCIYAEAAACAHYSHDWIWTIASQMRRYSRAGYPVGNGLFEASVIIRKNTARVRTLMEAWWREYRSGARRDQLSLPYVSWLSGVPLGSMGESDPRFVHRYFKLAARPARPKVGVALRKYVNRATALAVSYEKLFRVNASVAWDQASAK